MMEIFVFSGTNRHKTIQKDEYLCGLGIQTVNGCIKIPFYKHSMGGLFGRRWKVKFREFTSHELGTESPVILLSITSKEK